MTFVFIGVVAGFGVILVKSLGRTTSNPPPQPTVERRDQDQGDRDSAAEPL